MTSQISDSRSRVAAQARSSKGAYSGLRSALITEKMVDGILTRMETIEYSATRENGGFSRSAAIQDH